MHSSQTCKITNTSAIQDKRYYRHLPLCVRRKNYTYILVVWSCVRVFSQWPMHLLAVQAKSMHSFYYGLILKMEARSSLSFAASWDRSGILLRRFRIFFLFRVIMTVSLNWFPDCWVRNGFVGLLCINRVKIYLCIMLSFFFLITYSEWISKKLTLTKVTLTFQVKWYPYLVI